MEPMLPAATVPGHPRAPTGAAAPGNTRARSCLAPDVDVSAELPRVVAWLRTEHPSATTARIEALLSGLAPERLHRLEGVLDDLARTCRPPAAADLAALTELDDLLERGAPG